MAFTTLPNEAPGSNTIADWQLVGATIGPDSIVTGLTLSLPASNVVRLAVGRAQVGGLVANNPSAVDFTAIANASGVTRYDRLVLRLTFTSGGSVDIQPVVKSGTSLPGLTQTLNVGTYEISLGHWYVIHGTAVVAAGSLVGDGPGRIRALDRERASWSDTRAVEDAVGSGVLGNITGLSVPANEVIPGVYVATYVSQVRMAGTLGSATSTIEYYFGSPGKSVRLGREVHDGARDFATYTEVVRSYTEGVALNFNANFKPLGQSCWAGGPSYNSTLLVERVQEL